MTISGNLVFQFTSGTGTGNLTLSSMTVDTPPQYFRNFSSVFGIGSTNTFYYCIRHRSASQFEVGYGHMSDSSTLVRDFVIESSNSNAAVNFSAGTKDVISDVPATLQNESPSIAISASDINWALDKTFSKSIGATTPTFTFTNTIDGKTIVVAITATSGTVTWPAVSWTGTTAPTQTVNKTDVYTFVKIGSTIYGSVVPNMP